MKNCKTCGSKLGIDCGDAEPDYNDNFCSKGCYKERMLNLKKEIAQSRKDDLELSNKVAAKDWETYKIEIPENKTIIKQYRGSDLPLYFKWETECKEVIWIWKVYVKEGRIKVDKVMKQNGCDLEYQSSTINSAFNNENKECKEKEWIQLVHDLVIKLGNENL